MKLDDMRQKNAEDLRNERVALYRELFNLRMQRSSGQLAKPHLFVQVRRNIARINTLLTERQAGGQS